MGTIADIRTANAMRDIDAFVSAWQALRPAYIPSGEIISVSAAGNYNIGGILGGLYAPALTPTNVNFYTVIEPNVRPVVEVLVGLYGLVTYTSCEGHWYPGGEFPPSELHVGILPRCADESAALQRALSFALKQRTHTYSESSLVLVPGTLEDQSTGAQRPVLDLYLRKSPALTWQSYFHTRGADVKRLVHLLFDVRPLYETSINAP